MEVSSEFGIGLVVTEDDKAVGTMVVGLVDRGIGGADCNDEVTGTSHRPSV